MTLKSAPPANQTNAHFNLYDSLKKCPKPSWQGFRPPTPSDRQCPKNVTSLMMVILMMTKIIETHKNIVKIIKKNSVIIYPAKQHFLSCIPQSFPLGTPSENNIVFLYYLKWSHQNFLCANLGFGPRQGGGGAV